MNVLNRYPQIFSFYTPVYKVNNRKQRCIWVERVKLSDNVIPKAKINVQWTL